MTRECEPRAITIAILAMGGEGGGVLADWIVDVAEYAGYWAQTTSVPGVAQRTGSTIYYLELFPAAAAEKEPVLALMPVPGEVDIVIASELMEAGRAVERGLVTPDRTTLIASTNRVYSMTEKTVAADGRVDSSALITAAAAAAKNFVHCDYARIAAEHGSVISAALLGALASTGALPFHRSRFEEGIRRAGVGVDSSLAAFAAGFDAVANKPIDAELPPGADEIVSAGVQRLTDYQDERYAAEYLDRLNAIRAADLRGDVLRETARYLALWMSYEDAIRVADLKIRQERFERVRREARAGPAELLHIDEFLHPRVEEITAILPAGLSWVSPLVARFTTHGRIVRTTSLSGYLLLYALASLRPWRRKSSRFQAERRNIDGWLAAVVDVARENYELALEVAECPRLLKGYGDTYRRGRERFDVLMEALPELRKMPDGAAELRNRREAFLRAAE